MYRRILVAVDGSDTAQLALEHAMQLAKDQRASLRIVHAVESMHYMVSMAGGYPFDATGLIEAMRDEGAQVLAGAEAKARNAGVPFESALLEGKEPQDRVATLLAKDAQRWDADLIVLGTHGRRGFDRVFLGSVAEALVRLATRPVLLVRAK